ncbi:UPF0688 protein C1orf174 homolog, partial [Rhea pennata]|uniref:UPF0688 protein C1orf174 homolog n=1 Tax=Rhea pennata TaxID=8795 RepID=UPI002E254E9C
GAGGAAEAGAGGPGRRRRRGPPKPHAAKPGGERPGSRAEEESGGGSVLPGEAGADAEEGGPRRTPARLDDSALVDEDSNQPMPVDRFFGNVEFLQDIPAVALASTTVSRREFRKLHFIAKEDEEEEEDLL